MDKKELPRMSLLQFKFLLDETEEQEVRVYVNRNVGVVKRLVPSATLRFAQHPFVLEEMRVMMLRQGRARIVVNLLPLELHGGELLFLAPHATIEVLEYSPDIEGQGFSMTGELFALAMGEAVPRALDGHLRHFVMPLSDGELGFFTQLIDMLYDTVGRADYSSHVFLSLAATFWWYVDSLHKRQRQIEVLSPTHDQQLFARFIALVNEHARREHTLDFYADRLCLSSRYMGTIVKKVSGRSAKAWVDEALATAIKVELRHSTKPLKQIADETHFPNMSFFSKFFRRMAGMTPQEYRSDAEEGRGELTQQPARP